MAQFDLGRISDVELFGHGLLLRIEFADQIDFGMEMVDVHDVADSITVLLEEFLGFGAVELGERMN